MGGKANSQMEPLSTRQLVALQNSAGANGFRPGPLSGDELLALAVMPLLHRAKKRGVINLSGSEQELEIAARLSVAFENGYDAVLFNNYKTAGGKKKILAVKNPEQLRSRFAAFDPSKIKSRNLLASLAAVGGVSVVLDDDEGEPKVYQDGPASPGGDASAD